MEFPGSSRNGDVVRGYLLLSSPFSPGPDDEGAPVNGIVRLEVEPQSILYKGTAYDSPPMKMVRWSIMHPPQPLYLLNLPAAFYVDLL